MLQLHVFHILLYIFIVLYIYIQYAEMEQSKET